jgi:tetratricopeptide (TPR) repeat protein
VDAETAGGITIMSRWALIAAALGMLAASAYRLNAPARQEVVDSAKTEAWPICSSMTSLAESADWAALDPDFAAGKRAIAAGDWNGAIKTLTLAGLRDDRNADIQDYIGYVYRRLWQLDLAMRYYQQALTLNPRHRGAHEHLGEAYLMRGNLAKAEEHLAALERICLIPCLEYEDLKQAIAAYSTIASTARGKFVRPWLHALKRTCLG